MLRNIRILYDLFDVEIISLRQKVKLEIDSFFEVLLKLEQFLNVFIQLLEHLLLGIYNGIFITLFDFLFLILGLRFLHHLPEIEISHELFCSRELVIIFEILGQTIFVIEFV